MAQSALRASRQSMCRWPCSGGHSGRRWGPHIELLHAKVSTHLHFLRHLKRSAASPDDLLSIYMASIRSVLEYACQPWSTSLMEQQCDLLKFIQRRALRIKYLKPCTMRKHLQQLHLLHTMPTCRTSCLTVLEQSILGFGGTMVVKVAIVVHNVF